MLEKSLKNVNPVYLAIAKMRPEKKLKSGNIRKSKGTYEFRKERNLKRVGITAVGLISLGLMGLGIKSYNRSLSLTPQDFQNAEWIQYDVGENIGIDALYLSENIARTQENRFLYEISVMRRNNNRLEETVYLPDLDKDGKVGARY